MSVPATSLQTLTKSSEVGLVWSLIVNDDCVLRADETVVLPVLLLTGRRAVCIGAASSTLRVACLATDATGGRASRGAEVGAVTSDFDSECHVAGGIAGDELMKVGSLLKIRPQPRMRQLNRSIRLCAWEEAKVQKGSN